MSDTFKEYTRDDLLGVIKSKDDKIMLLEGEIKALKKRTLIVLNDSKEQMLKLVELLNKYQTIYEEIK